MWIYEDFFFFCGSSFAFGNSHSFVDIADIWNEKKKIICLQKGFRSLYWMCAEEDVGQWTVAYLRHFVVKPKIPNFSFVIRSLSLLFYAMCVMRSINMISFGIELPTYISLVRWRISLQPQINFTNCTPTKSCQDWKRTILFLINDSAFEMATVPVFLSPRRPLAPRIND